MPVEDAVLSQSCNVAMEMRGDTAVVSISSTSADPAASGVLAEVSRLARGARGKVVLDASQVRPINCAWLNLMIELTRQCRAMGGEMVVSGLCHDSRKAVRRSGLNPLLNVVAKPEEGIALIQGIRSWVNLICSICPPAWRPATQRAAA